MSTKTKYSHEEIGAGKAGFSKTRAIIETPFYGNNVIKVNTLREAYELAKRSPGTVVTDMPVFQGEEFGLPPRAPLTAVLFLCFCNIIWRQSICLTCLPIVSCPRPR